MSGYINRMLHVCDKINTEYWAGDVTQTINTAKFHLYSLFSSFSSSWEAFLSSIPRHSPSKLFRFWVRGYSQLWWWQLGWWQYTWGLYRQERPWSHIGHSKAQGQSIGVHCWQWRWVISTTALFYFFWDEYFIPYPSLKRYGLAISYACLHFGHTQLKMRWWPCLVYMDTIAMSLHD